MDQRKVASTEIHRRLKPGAPFVVAHLSLPQGEAERALWLSRYAAFADIAPDQVGHARAAMDKQLTILAPEQDESILKEVGFSNVALFYAGFAFSWLGKPCVRRVRC